MNPLQRYVRMALAALVVAVAVGLAVRSWRQDQAQHVRRGFGVGGPAPDFTLDDLYGKPVRLSQFRGRPVLINFWASWCDPCKKELPTLTAWYSRQRRRVVLLGIDMAATGPDEARQARALAERVGVTYPVLFAGDQVPGQYQVSDLPTSVWVDARGVVRTVLRGELTVPRLDAVERQFVR